VRRYALVTRYLDLLQPRPPAGPRPRHLRRPGDPLARDRGTGCLTLDYDALRGVEDDSLRLF
jgi:hypothetical protein